MLILSNLNSALIRDRTCDEESLVVLAVEHEVLGRVWPRIDLGVSSVAVVRTAIEAPSNPVGVSASKARPLADTRSHSIAAYTSTFTVSAALTGRRLRRIVVSTDIAAMRLARVAKRCRCTGETPNMLRRQRQNLHGEPCSVVPAADGSDQLMLEAALLLATSRAIARMDGRNIPPTRAPRATS